MGLSSTPLCEMRLSQSSCRTCMGMKMNMAISLRVRKGKSKPEDEGHDFFEGIRGVKF